MGYRINVARRTHFAGDDYRYSHLFATDPETLINACEAAEVLKKLQKAFPAPDYDVSISERQATGKPLNPKKFLKDYYHESLVVKP
jgi:hypothetical protein